MTRTFLGLGNSKIDSQEADSCPSLVTICQRYNLLVLNFEQKFHEFWLVRIIIVMASLLEVRGLTVELPTAAGWVRLVNEVSLRIGVGESLGLVGESGSCKTMLFSCLWPLTLNFGLSTSFPPR